MNPSRFKRATGRPLVGFALIFACGLMLPSSVHAQAPDIVYEKLPPAPKWVDGYRLRYAIRLLGDPVKDPAKTALARIPTGGWLKPDASDVVVQNAAGQVFPVAVLSHQPSGDTIVQFKRTGPDRWYWIYAGGNKPPPGKPEPMPEGLTMEVREWAGDDLASWAAVRTGLQKSENVIGNGIVQEVIQTCNPARPDQPRKFAASYRGYLNIKKPGIYRFFANGDDATFLFIDGFKVQDKPGVNNRVVGSVPLRSVGTDVNLTAGVHPFEVHHVVGTNPQSLGVMLLMWVKPGDKAWSPVRYTEMVQGMYGHVASLESAAGEASALLFGLEDSLISGGLQVYLTRFEAVGVVKNPEKLEWDFGDGSKATGRSVAHVYFKAGTYNVTLKPSDGSPPFKRAVHVWPAPGQSSPLSLGEAVKVLTASGWNKQDFQRVSSIFEFLLACEQPNRWPLLEAVSRHLLAQTELEPKTRALAYSSLMESLAEQGKAQEAFKQLDPALKFFKKLPTLQVGIKLTAGEIHGRFLKDLKQAARIYQGIIDDHRRVEHPDVRVAAIRLGDLQAEAGNLTRAAEAYRLANTLGGDKFQATAGTDAVARGALLRIAEQKLRKGDIRQSRVLLDKIELEYPEQKLEGLYRYLRAESDRFSGRYEEAIRNYEVLLQLVQWAGFRDRASHGIADCFYRMGELEKSLKWYNVLKKTHPDYFAKQKLDDFQKFLMARLTGFFAKDKDAPLRPIAINFEPGEKSLLTKLPNFSIVPGLSLNGPHQVLLDGFPAYRAYLDFGFDLPNIIGDGYYLLEIWYREQLCSKPENPHIHMWILGPKNESNPEGSQGTAYFDRTDGQWRKFAFRIKAPLTQDGKFAVSVRHIYGVMEFDGLRITPITARQVDSLNAFIEGVENQ